jgi:spore coat polysaccharide biosynthesis protein SpsF
MNSSRLPGKVLLDLGGEPMLVRVVERSRRAKTLAAVGVATTTDPSDDAVAALCTERGYLVSRGSQFDVLDRYYQAAKQFQADVIVRITADCPVMDPDLIDETVKVFLEEKLDFAATRLPPPWHRTYPIGLDIEVCSFTGLEQAWKNAAEKFEREHVMPYFYDTEGRFKIRVLDYEQDYGTQRWTVDTAPDLDMLRAIYARFDNRDDFTWLDIVKLIEREPELVQINAGVHHKMGTDVDERQQPA